MTAADRISRWLAELRATGHGPLVARLATAVSGTVALVLPGLLPWDQMDLIPLLGAPLLVAAVVLPDSAAGLLFLVVVAGGWLVRAPAEVGWAVVVTAIALLVFHLSAAFAGQLPSYGQVSRRALRRWLLPATVGAALAPLAAVGAALVRDAAVPGSLLVTVGALTAATVAVWFAAGQSLGDRDD